MSLIDRKIKDSERDSLNVKSVQGNRLTGTVQENKNVFDRLTEFLANRYNLMIDDLTGPAAAGEIGADVTDVAAKTVQGVLDKYDADIKDRYTKAETDALTGQETKDLVVNVDIDLNTGVIAITKKDGVVKSWNTTLEKIPSSFVDSNEIAFAATADGPEKTVTASIQANSIEIDKLSLSAISQMEGYVSSAAQSALIAETQAGIATTSAEASAQSAQTATDKATQASASQTAAKTSQTASKASQTAAKASETAATNANTAAQAAKTSADKSAQIARDAADSIYLVQYAPPAELLDTAVILNPPTAAELP